MSLDEKQKDKTELKVSPEEEPSEASPGAEVSVGSDDAKLSVDSDGAAAQTKAEGADHSHGEPTPDSAGKHNEANDGQTSTAQELPNFGDNYEPIEIIGHGGMGAVYKVKELSTGTTFAVKLLQKSLADDPGAQKRFEQEVSSASKLTHPNLVAVYGHGKTPTGAPYLVMDYLDGRSLSDVIEKEGRLEPKRALNIFIQIAEALKHAHDKGVIHRDIKPTNIILSSTPGGDDIVKIVDFGIAKVLPATSRETRDLTQTGEVFGSPHYMSPEQCLGFMLDQRSDIYSFGCLMYEAVTGEPPFGGSNPIQLVVKHINESPPNFQKELKTNKQIKLLETVVLKCLDKEQSERFQSVDELKRDLESIRDDRPIARYATKRAKPTLTRQQLIGGVALSFLLFYYIGTASSAVSPQTSGMVMGGMLSLLAAAGAFIFLKAGVARLFNAYRRRETPGRWWVAIILTSIGMAASCLVPWTMRLALWDYSMTSPAWADAICTLGTIFHEIFLFIGVISIIGFAVTRSARRVGPGFIAVWFTGLSAAIISWSLILVPDKVANIPISIGSSLTQHMPDLAVPLYKAAASLDPTNSRWWEVANLQERINQIKDALDSLNNVSEDRTETGKPQVGVRARRAEDLMKLGLFDDALKIIQSIQTDLAGGTSDVGEGLLANWYAKQGMYQQALNVIAAFEKTEKKDPEGTQDSSYHYSFHAMKLDIYLAMGEIQKAFDLCDKRTSSGASNNLLRGILLDKLNRTGEARACYKELLKTLSHYPENIERLNRYGGAEMLLGGYAYQMLGDLEKAKELFALAYRIDESVYLQDQKFFGRSLRESMRHRLAEQLGLNFAEKTLPLPVEFQK